MSTMTQKTHKSRTKSRRSHHGLKAKTLATCEKCEAKITPHQACPKCGHYRGRKILDITKRVLRTKRNKKNQQ